MKMVRRKIGEFSVLVSERDWNKLINDQTLYGQMVFQYTEPNNPKSIRAKRVDPIMVRVVNA